MIEILTVALTRPKTGIGSNPQNVIADDVNRDNQLHVIITIPKNDSITMLLGNSNGTFSTELTYSTDLNSDGRDDIMLSRLMAITIFKILFNVC
jgi:hypothetical protein